MLRVTEGPFFSEVETHYEHVQLVFRLHNLPGELQIARTCLRVARPLTPSLVSQHMTPPAWDPSSP